MLPIRHRRTISLAKNPGSLIRFTFHGPGGSGRREKWRPRMDLHHQPPDPKSGALLIELQGVGKCHVDLGDGIEIKMRYAGGILTMSIWKALLLVYRRIDVRLPAGWFRRNRFVHELPEEELREVFYSFRAFPPLVEDLSKGEAGVTYETAIIDEPLSSVTAEGDGMFWPSPDDTRRELDTLAIAGRYDSVFVLWPQRSLTTAAHVPCRGWGLGSGPSDWSNGATYAVVGNAPAWAWRIPVVGEVWLHEWLHGVCSILIDQGFAMPEYDADAGGSHGYVQSPDTGWTDFYRDLMTGQVLENGDRKGITPEAWRSLKLSASIGIDLNGRTPRTRTG